MTPLKVLIIRTFIVWRLAFAIGYWFARPFSDPLLYTFGGYAVTMVAVVASMRVHER